MPAVFKNSLISDTFLVTREWRNGRRAGLRIRCRKAWGFKSPLSHPNKIKAFRSIAMTTNTKTGAGCG
jgi:hypothetical protein